MTLQLGLAVRGDLKAWSTAVSASVEKGGRNALRIATQGLRKDLRGRISRAGFRRPGLSRTLVAKVTADQGRVYSVAGYPSGGRRTHPVDLIQLFSEGAVIQAASGEWLAIPTGEGPRKGKRWATPEEERALGWKTAIIPARHGGNMVVIATVAHAHYVTHVLMRRVTLRKRYDLDSAVAAWKAKMPTMIAGEITKASEGLAG